MNLDDLSRKQLRQYLESGEVSKKTVHKWLFKIIERALDKMPEEDAQKAMLRLRDDPEYQQGLVEAVFAAIFD